MQRAEDEMRVRAAQVKRVTTKASSRNGTHTGPEAPNNKEHPVITSVSAALDLIIMKGARAF